MIDCSSNSNKIRTIQKHREEEEASDLECWATPTRWATPAPTRACWLGGEALMGQRREATGLCGALLPGFTNELTNKKQLQTNKSFMSKHSGHVQLVVGDSQSDSIQCLNFAKK